MGDRYLTDLADVLRRAGCQVTELDGWRDRARGSGGYDQPPSHVMVHHTASPPSASGADDAWYCAEGDEDAPLSNLCLDRSGVWWVLAAGATNTNGKGGPLDGVPADSMNTRAIGVEANGGYGEPWPKVQQDAYLIGVRALQGAYGCPHVRAHFEWAPDRKIDPAGQSRWSPDDSSWSMDAFRADLETTGGDDMALTDDDVDRIAEAVWARMLDTTSADAGIDPEPARYYLQRTFLIVRQYLGGFHDEQWPGDPTLLRQVYENTK